MAGSAQPDDMPDHKFRLDNVLAFEDTPGAYASANVIVAGDSLRLRIDLGFDGALDGMLAGQSFSIFHHVQNIETGALTTLPGGAFVVPGTKVERAHITVASGPYTTGDTGSGANLEIPATFDAGTFRITTHVHADNPAVKPLVAAFDDGLVIMVIKP